MRTTRRILILCAAVAMLVAVLAIPAIASPEGTLASRINAARASVGLEPLEGYWDLTDDARSHTGAMISAGHLYHNPSLAAVTGVWEKLGENVGVGFDANELHDAFMASPGHRSNVLGDFNYVGIGVETDADGLMWVTVIFMKAPPGLNGGGDSTTSSTAASDTAATSTVGGDSVTSTTYEVKSAGASEDPAPTVRRAVRVEQPEPIVGYGSPLRPLPI